MKLRRCVSAMPLHSTYVAAILRRRNAVSETNDLPVTMPSVGRRTVAALLHLIQPEASRNTSPGSQHITDLAENPPHRIPYQHLALSTLFLTAYIIPF